MWTTDGELHGGPVPSRRDVGTFIWHDWTQWVASPTPTGDGPHIRTHMLLQFSSNAGVDTKDKAHALVAKVLVGLNADHVQD